MIVRDMTLVQNISVRKTNLGLGMIIPDMTNMRRLFSDGGEFSSVSYQSKVSVIGSAGIVPSSYSLKIFRIFDFRRFDLYVYI